MSMQAPASCTGRDRAPFRHSRLLAALAIAALLASPAKAGLTSAPVDETLYRPGEVRHLRGTVGAWAIACDEVTRLRQRYCSLRTTARGGDAETPVILTISTGDDGRPAGLIELPTGIAVSSGMRILIAGEARGRKRFSRTLPVAQCDASRCYAVWTFGDQELASLNGGKRMTFAYEQVTTIEPFPAALARQRGQIIEAEIDTRSFAAAVSASIEVK